MELQHLPNLKIFHVQGDPQDPATQLLDDYTMRNFGRIALQELGFANLQSVLLDGLVGVTCKSLAYLNSFPMLGLFGLNRSILHTAVGVISDERSGQRYDMSKGWVMLNGTKSDAGQSLRVSFPYDYEKIGGKNALEILQTPSGKPWISLHVNKHKTLSYHVGGGQQPIVDRKRFELYICSSGGRIHDPETWLAVGLPPASAYERSASHSTTPQSKPVRIRKRKVAQDESLQDMLS